jgi:molecular chaperone GrpE
VTENPLPAPNQPPPPALVDGADGAAPDEWEAPEPSEGAELAAMEARLRRTLADLDNLRKRVDREIARERAAERAAVAARWLNVVDNLDRALQHAGGDSNALLDGVRAVRDEAVGILAQLGFPRYEDVGRRFDPARHEALSAMQADAPPGTVLAVIRPGYGSAQGVLRPAGVVVSRGPAPAESD